MESALRPDLQPGGSSAPGPMVPERFRVTDKRREIADTWTLELEPLDRDGRLHVPAGPVQHALRVRRGRGADLGQRRPAAGHSGSCTPSGRWAPRAGRSAARYPVTCSVSGVRSAAAGPPTKAAGRDVVIVAGGIGLAPLRPVVYEVLSERDRYGRALLLYGGREPDQLLYEAEHDAWRERGSGGRGHGGHRTCRLARQGRAWCRP